MAKHTFVVKKWEILQKFQMYDSVSGILCFRRLNLFYF